MPRSPVHILTMLFLFMIWTTPVQSQELVVAFSERPPWKITKNGKPAGIEVDIIEAAARHLGITLRYQQNTFTNCLKLMRQGKADIMTGVVMSPKREKYLVYITPPYETESTTAFYALQGRAAGITRYEHLRGIRTGTKTGAKHFAQFDSDSTLRKSRYSNLRTLFTKLRNGTIGAVAADEAAADYWLRINPDDALRVQKTPLRHKGYAPIFLTISAKSPFASRANELGAIIVQFMQDGTLDEIKSRYSRH